VHLADPPFFKILLFFSDEEIYGHMFEDGEQHRRKIIFRAGTRVYRRVRTRSADRASCTINIPALLFQLERPGEVGVPVLYQTDANSDTSNAMLSFTNGVYSRWARVNVFGRPCCVAQLVCLLQFSMSPVNPQKAKPKYINHGYNRETALFETNIYNQNHVLGQRVINVSSDSDASDESDASD